MIKKTICTLLLAAGQSLSAEQVLVSNFSEDEYESVERVFANNMGHIDHLVDFIDSNVIAQGGSKESFLDIGAGPATISTQLSKFFKSTTIIDPNRNFAPIYKEKGFTYFTGNFQDVEMEGTYDVVLCSHVLYHVPRAQWAPFLKKLNGLIRPGGTGVVTMVAPKGKFHELLMSINRDYSNSSQVEKALKEQGIAYDLVPVQSSFNVPNYDDFRAVVRLFAIEDCYLPDAYQALNDSARKTIDKKIEDYIATCKQPDGSYQFFNEDVYIVIHKGGV